jgi:hypothetical protein
MIATIIYEHPSIVVCFSKEEAKLVSEALSLFIAIIVFHIPQISSFFFKQNTFRKNL